MSLSAEQLLAAKETVNGLLEDLALEAYLFEVQPGEQGWDVRVECAIEGGWQNSRISVGFEELIASHDDEALRRKLFEEWKRCLGTCKRNAP